MNDETLIYRGGTVKSLGHGRFEAPLVLFGSPEKKDLVGDYFTAETDFWQEFPSRTPLLYQHGMDETVKARKFGTATLTETPDGVWMAGQLDMADAYAQKIYALIEAGKMGTSSGSASHLVEREPAGGGAFHVKSWPIVEASLTPTPCEPRNAGSVVPLKTFFDMASLADGDAYATHSAQVVDAVEEFTRRTRARLDLRVKSGRVLSAANLTKINATIAALTDVRDMATAPTADEQKAALLTRALRRRAELSAGLLLSS